jgi:hypothetical protein
MRIRIIDFIVGVALAGSVGAAGPAAAQRVIDLGTVDAQDRSGHGRPDVEVSVTSKGDTAIIIRRSSGSDSVRVHEDSDVVRTGESITIDAGRVIDGDVVAIGGSVTVSGRVRGDAVAIGGDVTVTDGGRIDGDAVSIGGRVNRDPGAHIGGQNVGMSFIPAGIFAPRGATRGPIAILKGISLFVVIMFVLKMLFVLAVGWVARALARNDMDRFGHTVIDGPWRSLFVGLGAHFALAILLVVLCITVVGLVVAIPAGIALVPLNAMSLALIAALLGHRIGRGRAEGTGATRPWTGSAAIGLALLSLPVVLGLLLLGTGGVGTVIAFVLLFFGGTVITLAGATGFGAMVLTLFDRRHRGTMPTPGAPAWPSGPPISPPAPPLSTDAT